MRLLTTAALCTAAGTESEALRSQTSKKQAGSKSFSMYCAAGLRGSAFSYCTLIEIGTACVAVPIVKDMLAAESRPTGVPGS